ncbi:hypothetical protein V8C35DRAFT_331141 [Trichoderma chlorosporum]
MFEYNGDDILNMNANPRDSLNTEAARFSFPLPPWADLGARHLNAEYTEVVNGAAQSMETFDPSCGSPLNEGRISDAAPFYHYQSFSSRIDIDPFAQNFANREAYKEFNINLERNSSWIDTPGSLQSRGSTEDNGHILRKSKKTVEDTPFTSGLTPSHHKSIFEKVLASSIDTISSGAHVTSRGIDNDFHPDTQISPHRVLDTCTAGTSSPVINYHQGWEQSAAEQDPGRKPKQFACPFNKWSRDLHRDCYNLRFSNATRVKEHIRNKHMFPLYCPCCYRMDFEQRTQRDEHIRNRTCKVEPEREVAGYDLAMQEHREVILNKAKPLTDEKRWKAMWKALFPDCKLPSSFYVDE